MEGNARAGSVGRLLWKSASPLSPVIGISRPGLKKIGGGSNASGLPHRARLSWQRRATSFSRAGGAIGPISEGGSGSAIARSPRARRLWRRSPSRHPPSRGSAMGPRGMAILFSTYISMDCFLSRIRDLHRGQPSPARLHLERSVTDHPLTDGAVTAARCFSRPSRRAFTPPFPNCKARAQPVARSPRLPGLRTHPRARARLGGTGSGRLGH